MAVHVKKLDAPTNTGILIDSFWIDRLQIARSTVFKFVITRSVSSSMDATQSKGGEN